jgi:hypothetical protein
VIILEHHRYGADWDKYKEAVPWLFFPGVY